MIFAIYITERSKGGIFLWEMIRIWKIMFGNFTSCMWLDCFILNTNMMCTQTCTLLLHNFMSPYCFREKFDTLNVTTQVLHSLHDLLDVYGYLFILVYGFNLYIYSCEEFPRQASLDRVTTYRKSNSIHWKCNDFVRQDGLT